MDENRIQDDTLILAALNTVEGLLDDAEASAKEDAPTAIAAIGRARHLLVAVISDMMP